MRDIHWSEFRDLGGRVVGLGHARGLGKESGVDFESPYACLAEFHEGKIVRYADYFDHRQALEGAGLRE